MVSPNLSLKKSESSSLSLNESAKRFFQVVYTEKKEKEREEEDETPKIRVSTLISEDHLLRKNAIARILKRQIVIEGTLKSVNSQEIASHLLVELIRAAYLPNNKIPEQKITEVATLIDKYIILKLESLHALDSSSLSTKMKNIIKESNKLVNWLIDLVACEIEEILLEDKVKQVASSNLFDFLSKNITLPPDSPYASDLEIQIYLSICRNFAKFDADMLRLVLFKYYNSGWTSFSASANEMEIRSIGKNIKSLRNAVEDQLQHPLIRQIDKIVKKYSLFYSIFLEIISSDPVKAYADIKTGPKSYASLISKTCEQKYNKVRGRLWRAAVRSIIYIFLTKSVFVVALEVPVIKWLNEPINYSALAINVAFPAVLLFLIIAFIKTPSSKNTEKIVEGINELTIGEGKKKVPFVLRQPKKRGWLIDLIFGLVYTAAFFFSVYVIVLVLNRFNFTWVSITIFLFFLAFVSFFSTMIKKDVKEFIVIESRENIFSFLIDLFYMPIIAVGKWLSNNVSKVNIFVFIFDFIIEAPFKVFVNVAEEWTRYVKERKDEISN
ncbi:MAG: hypothetical protein MUF50_04660 [Planctomycetes bacterium]|nr:hypothetical protein [Planctomycetota bacterium]